LAIGAAPLTAWLSSPPKMARTFLNSSCSACSNGAASSGGTSRPRAWRSRTVTPSFAAAFILSWTSGGCEPSASV
jgi:hypothetical protein